MNFASKSMLINEFLFGRFPYPKRSNLIDWSEKKEGLG